jgi:3-dehydroquinate synthase
MTVIPIKTESARYDVTLQWGGLKDMTRELADRVRPRLFLLAADQTVGDLYADAVEDALSEKGAKVARLTLPAGEVNKTLKTVDQLYGQMFLAGADRGSHLVALGGGITGDIAGFAASTFMRGIPLSQIPTTLLAQVDSSVGGKVGVNHPKAGKNMVGLFVQPKAVLVDPAVLETLSDRDFASGLAEVVKYGILGHEDFFKMLEDNAEAVRKKEKEKLLHAIEKSIRAKADVVEKDENEAGPRALLNLGHTFGHALEAVLPKDALSHGEAVSVGLCAAAALSTRVGLLPEDEAGRVQKLLARLGLPTSWPRGADPRQAVRAMRHDKKFVNQKPRIVLVEKIGKAVLHECPLETLQDFVLQFSRR